MKKVALAIVASLCLLSACTQDYFTPYPNSGEKSPERTVVEGIGYEKVLILYLEGYNNLSLDIMRNIDEFSKGYIPKKSDKQAVVVYAHNSVSKLDWHTKTEPVIYRMYTHYDEVVKDTLYRFPSEEAALNPETMRKALSFIKQKFPTSSYGMLFSSHASGWIPKEYTVNSEGSPFSIGAEYDNSGPKTVEYNLNVEEFAAALPMHLDYIIFDCCLMGGVETNYSLRKCCDHIVAAPTEVLSEGFDYYGMGDRLLREGEPDLVGVCEDFYNKCAKDSYATVALYDCSYMDELTDKCKSIFDNHPNQVLDVKSSEVQSYNFSFNYHYDFRDIIAKMGASEEELDRLDECLEKVVIYKKATPKFFYVTINPETYSGMSMYLPRKGWDELNEYYLNTEWNKATGLLR